MENALNVLGVRLRIRADPPALAEQFLTVFGAFSDPNPTDGDELKEIPIRIDGASGTYEDGRRTVRLAGERLRESQVYNLLYTTLVRALEGVYLLHGAVVAERERAWIISGPSGSGKSSLGLALVDRGFDLMSDDLAPLSLSDRLIHPFPRRLGFVRGSDGSHRAGRAGAVEMGDKTFVTADQVGARQVEKALPPGAVVLMNPFDPTGRTIEMVVCLLVDPGPLRERLEGVAGVEIELSHAEEGLSVLNLRLEGSEAITATEAALQDAEENILFHYRTYGRDKTYAAEPSLQRIPLHEGVLGLLREALNRERSSALMQRLQGRLTSAVLELCGLLEGVPCYQLTPADVESTADLLEKTFRELPLRP